MLEEKKSTKILKIYAKLQKIFVFAFFFSFILLFIYCLGFFTPYYEVTTFNGEFPITDASYFGITISDLQAQFCPEGMGENCGGLFGVNSNGDIASINMRYFTKFAEEDVQNLNHMLFYFSVFGIVISLLLFIFRSHIRRKYYITNHIVTGICSVYSLVTCIILFIQFGKYENALNDVNYDLINAFYTNQKAPDAEDIISKFSKSSFDFIYVIGRIILIVIIIATILLILVNIAKVLAYRTSEKKELVKGEE